MLFCLGSPGFVGLILAPDTLRSINMQLDEQFLLLSGDEFSRLHEAQPPIKKQGTACGSDPNLTFAPIPPSASDPGFFFFFFFIPGHLCLSNVMSVSRALAALLLVKTLHLSVSTLVCLSLDSFGLFHNLPPSLFPLPLLFCQPAVGEAKQRLMCFCQKRSSAVPLSHE